MSKYRSIVADPPWDYGKDATRWIKSHTGGKRQPIPYEAMTVAEISRLPISDLALPDCVLWLWTTNAYLPAAFGVMSEWGFSYRQTFVWHKTNAPPMGGSVAPNSAEFLLIGKKGRPTVGRLKSSVHVASSPGSHSQKPDLFLDLIESVSPGPYLELFARRNRIGWDTWGNESLLHIEITGWGA